VRLEKQKEAEGFQLESMTEQRRSLIDVLIVSVLVVAIVWLAASLYLRLTDTDVLGAMQYPAELTTTASGLIILYCIVAFALNRQKKLRLIGVNAAILITLLTLSIALSDSPDQLISGRTSFVLLVPVFLSAELIHPAASVATVMIELLIMVAIASGNEVLLISKFEIAMLYFLSIIAWATATKKIASTTIAHSESVKNLAILQTMADGIMVLDRTGQVTQANNATLRILEGRDPAELVQALQTSEIRDGMHYVEWTSTKVIAVATANLHDNAGTVLSLRDYTRESIVANMTRTVLAIVSHELRTPIAAIRGFSDLLALAGEKPEIRKEAIESINSNVVRLLHITGDLLDSASLQAGTLSINKECFVTADLVDKVEKATRHLAESKGLLFNVKVERDLQSASICSDINRLTQVCVNLLMNAIKFTDQGHVDLEISLSGGNLHIAVSDAGPGIPAENIEFIFEPFRRLRDFDTRKHQGAGLGLSIVKKLTELLGGKVSVSSTVGRGSQFLIVIPVGNQEENV
jgi:signal transduction histidine kinase